MSSLSYSNSSAPAEVLMARNQSYVLANSYQKEGKFDLALQSYQEALLAAEDRVQATQIRLDIAFMTEFLGNYKEAISQLKTIAANSSDSYAIARAYAVQEIGLMYYNHYESDIRQVLVEETFKDSPYDSFKEGDSLNVAYTKLFEYAASLYPLGISESRIAYGYANELRDTLNGATTTPQGKAYILLINQSVTAAVADIQRMEDVGEVSLIPGILTHCGVALERLSLLGVIDLQEVELFFKKGLQYAASIGNRSGSFSAYAYATFLVSHYKSTRTEEIRSILSPFRVDNKAEIDQNIIRFFRAARANQSFLDGKERLVELGKISPTFKTYLISLGWEETDFK